MKRSLAYGIVASCAFLWCASILLTPMIASIEDHSGSVSHVMYTFFSPICHQYDSRSLHIFGHKTPVCVRCLSIYIGFFIGVLVFPLFKNKPVLHVHRWWAIALLPMVLDVLADLLGFHSGTLATRMATGLLFGVIAGCIMLPALTEAISEYVFHRQHHQGVSYEPEAR
ncbi:MAG: DUF2085 domain-containing protein [Ignavibacteria bacterium]|nr:DUF2085 domain-containing protein [Ignavibacteria bacterium]MBI3766595.1 DUF2085 domain-containing protein [Ignavibacteriales bacterium]